MCVFGWPSTSSSSFVGGGFIAGWYRVSLLTFGVPRRRALGRAPGRRPLLPLPSRPVRPGTWYRAQEPAHRARDPGERAWIGSVTGLVPHDGGTRPAGGHGGDHHRADAGEEGSRGVVSYQDPYDGLGPQCDPSYNLRAGVAPVDRVVTPTVIGEYVAAGFAVVVPDYEQEQFANGAGQEEGYATLDGVRAAEHRLGAPEASAPVGLAGFWGGATATDYATELAPTYAPELDIVGAAEGGVAVDYVHNIDYVNGSPDWSEVVPAALVGSAGRSASTSTSTCRRSGRRSPLRSLVPAWAARPCPRRRSTSCSSPSTATFRRARVQAHVQPAHHEQDRNPERAAVACQWQF